MKAFVSLVPAGATKRFLLWLRMLLSGPLHAAFKVANWRLLVVLNHFGMPFGEGASSEATGQKFASTARSMVGGEKAMTFLWKLCKQLVTTYIMDNI